MSLISTFLASRAEEVSVDDQSKYRYVPTQFVAIIFVVLFTISTILHIGQATYYRMWWLFPTVCLCGMGEIAGWSGRLWSSISPTLDDPFMMQITCTILSPTPLVAANFILLSWLVSRLGACYARLSPTMYTVVFVASDFVALGIQGAGGGIAASATDSASANLGSHIMLAGLLFQFVAILVYISLAVDLIKHHREDRPINPARGGRGTTLDAKANTMIAGLALSTLVLTIRSIYRIVELAQGWDGRILRTEVYFNVLDGGMITIAMFVLNFAHPGRLLGSTRPTASPDHYVLKDVERHRSASAERHAFI
ncbi:RTA1-like protein [Mycena rebaudengoi]|nr:RTA1-like protein [Mycena rebaudengoi]